MYYQIRMAIQFFACAETERFYHTGKSRRFASVATVAAQKLDMLNAAATLADIRVPPGNRLEALRGDRAGQHSIRVNDQRRVCFVWTAAGPAGVEIVDYH